MNKFSLALNLFLAVALGAMVYLFVLKGSISESNDGRVAIHLNGAERDLVLEEMRGFLEGVEAITNALGEGNMAEASKHAASIGMAGIGDVPLSLMGKLPLDFKTLGLSTHKAFDTLSKETKVNTDPKMFLKKFGEILNNCTSCHAGYRLAVEKSK